MSLFSKVLTTYRRFVKDHLTLVQSLQAGTLMGAGDIIAQTLIERKQVREIDIKRTSNFFLIGCCFVGPALGVWYKFLDRRIGSGGSKSVVLKKVACDQLVFAPSFLLVFLGVLGVMQRHSLQEIQTNIKSKYPDILLTNYKLWPLVQICNFYFVPLAHQVLVVQCVALCWNVYLSWKTQEKTQQ